MQNYGFNLEKFLEVTINSPEFLGSTAGAFLGLLAILGGAMFNAYLNRKRDDRLKIESAITAATALRSAILAHNQCINMYVKIFVNPPENWSNGIIISTPSTEAYEYFTKNIGLIGIYDFRIPGLIDEFYTELRTFYDLSKDQVLTKPRKKINPQVLEGFAKQGKKLTCMQNDIDEKLNQLIEKLRA